MNSELRQPLVHVCRWRYVVPPRLNLRLDCTDRRPVRKMLDIWPALSIVIWNEFDRDSLVEGADTANGCMKSTPGAFQVGYWKVLPSLLLWSLDDSVPDPSRFVLNQTRPTSAIASVDQHTFSFFPIFGNLPLVASDRPRPNGTSRHPPPLTLVVLPSCIFAAPGSERVFGGLRCPDRRSSSQQRRCITF
jgi:hypothetical protein